MTNEAEWTHLPSKRLERIATFLEDYTGTGEGLARLRDEYVTDLLRLARDQREIADAGGIPNRIEAARAAQAAYENAADLVHSQRPENGGAVLAEAIEVFERRAVEANEGARRHPKTEIGHQFTSEAGIWRVASQVLRDLAKHLGDGGQGEAGYWIDLARDWAIRIASGNLTRPEETQISAVLNEIADSLSANLTQPVPSYLSEEAEWLTELLRVIERDYEKVLTVHPGTTFDLRAADIAQAREKLEGSLSASSDTGGAGAIKERLLGEVERIEHQAVEDRVANPDKANGKNAAALAMRRALDEL